MRIKKYDDGYAEAREIVREWEMQDCSSQPNKVLRDSTKKTSCRYILSVIYPLEVLSFGTFDSDVNW